MELEEYNNYKKKFKGINSCCIGISVFNCEFGLPYVLINIIKLHEVFNNVHLVVCYDHSNDRSLEILNNYQGSKDIIINDHIPYNSGRYGYGKTENISHARNIVLDKIKKDYSHYEYLIIMDSNEYSCVGDINIDLVKKTIIRNDWDSISFDREAGYYDYWALSFVPYVYSIYHMEQEWFRCNINNKQQIYKEYFLKELGKYKDNNELMDVYSAFNGFAIYRTQMFLNCSYSSDIDLSLFNDDDIKDNINVLGLNTLNRYNHDCEHRKFHMEARKKNNARIKISPEFMFSKFNNTTNKQLRGPA